MDPGPILATLGLFSVIIAGMVTLGPIARAFAERLRTKGIAPAAPEVQEQLDEVLGRLEEVQRQLGEVVERQEFTERLLAQAKARGALGPGA